MLYICLDNNGGYLLNNRPVSVDGAVSSYIFEKGGSLTRSSNPITPDVKEVCVFRWNKLYPADEYISFNHNWRYHIKEYISTNCHGDVAVEIYKRKE